MRPRLVSPEAAAAALAGGEGGGGERLAAAVEPGAGRVVERVRVQRELHQPCPRSQYQAQRKTRAVFFFSLFVVTTPINKKTSGGD